MMQTEKGLMMGDLHFTSVTIAVVPNVHATFYAQPSLVIGTNSASESR
jgi:hypothetical protein